MYKGKKILALVIARGGSKGIKNKNITDVGGRALIDWTFIAADKSKLVDRVILSSDDEKIIKRAHACHIDVPFKRPKNLALDESSAVDVAIHALESLKETYDYLVLLQATSPLREAQDIDKGIAQCIDKKARALMAIVKFDKNPYWLKSLNAKNELQAFLKKEVVPHRRQDSPDIFLPNGALYVIEVKTFLKSKTFAPAKTIGMEMPVERSVDIDTPKDLILARHYLSLKK